MRVRLWTGTSSEGTILRVSEKRLTPRAGPSVLQSRVPAIRCQEEGRTVTFSGATQTRLGDHGGEVLA